MLRSFWLLGATKTHSPLALVTPMLFVFLWLISFFCDMFLPLKFFDGGSARSVMSVLTTLIYLRAVHALSTHFIGSFPAFDLSFFLWKTLSFDYKIIITRHILLCRSLQGNPHRFQDICMI